MVSSCTRNFIWLVLFSTWRWFEGGCLLCI